MNLIFLAFSKDIPPRIFYPTSPLVAGSWLGLAPVIGLARQAFAGRGKKRRMQDVIVKIITMENEVNADIDRLVDLKAEIMRVIKAVASPEHQTLLELRYLCFKPWKVIADRMGYNVRHVYRLHEEAVESITIP